MESQKKSRRGLFFILGIAAGAAAGYYLNSDRGRRVRKDSIDTLGKWKDNAVSGAERALEQSRAYAHELANAASSVTNNAKSSAEEFIESNN